MKIVCMSALSGLFAGMLGAMGLGGGSVLLLYLTLILGIEQLSAQGINLLFFLPCALTALFFYRKERLIRWKSALWCALGGVFGVLLGSFLAGFLHTRLLSRLFAVFLLYVGLRELFPFHKRPAKEYITDYFSDEPDP